MLDKQNEKLERHLRRLAYRYRNVKQPWLTLLILACLLIVLWVEAPAVIDYLWRWIRLLATGRQN